MALYRKLIVLFLILLLSLGLFNIESFAVGQASENTKDFIYAQDDFDGNAISSFDSSLPSTATESYDDAHKKSLKLGFGGGHQYIGKFFDDPLPKGRYCFSLSMLKNSYENNSFFRIIGQASNGIDDWKNNYIGLRFDSSIKKYTLNTSSEWMERVDSFTDFDINKWYDIEIWIDTDLGEIKYIINGESIGTYKLFDEVEDIKGVVFRQEVSQFTNNGTYIDNVKFFREDVSECNGFDDVKISACTKDSIIGNNFYADELPEFDVEFVNRLPRNRRVKVNYTAKTNDGLKVFEHTRDIELKANGTYLDKVSISEKIYGGMVLTVSCDDSVKNIEYTVSNNTKNTPKNRRIGISAHVNRGRGGARETAILMSRAGIGTYRGEDLNWYNFEKVKNVYQPSEFDQATVDCFDEYDIDYLFLCGAGNPYYVADKSGLGTAPPSTEEGYLGLENFIREMLKKEKGKVNYIEVWNEWHSNSMSAGFSSRTDVYAELCRRIYKAAKEVDPEVKIVAICEDRWGLYNTGTMENMLIDMNGDKCFDYISLHPYSLSGAMFEGGEGISFIRDSKDLIEKKGYGSDVPLMFTELGWADAMVDGNLEKQAARAVRAQAYSMANNLAEVIYNYTMFDYPEYKRTSKLEASFGICQEYNYAGAEVPCLGKPAYCSFAYWNNLMAEGSFVESIEGIDESNQFGYRFRDRMNRDVLMLGVLDTKEDNVGLNLGVESVTVSDIYGNEKIINGVDGTFSFALKEDEITYVIGNFDEVKVCEGEFATDDLNINMPINGVYNFTINAPTGFEGKVVCDTLSSVKSIECGEFVNGRATLHFIGNETNTDGKCNIKVVNENKVYLDTTVNIKYMPSGKIENFRIERIDTNTQKWDAVFDVKNIRIDKPIDGTVSVPNKIKKRKLPVIAPNETRQIRIPMQSMSNISELSEFCALLDFSSGDSASIDEKFNYTCAKFTNEKPKIDGDLSDWKDDSDTLYLNKESQIRNISGWTGASDLSGKVNLKYDMENLYLSAEVTDNIFNQPNNYNAMWRGDSIQFALGFDINSINGTNYGVGLCPDGETYIYRNAQEGNIGGFGGEAAQTLYTDGEAKVIRQGDKTFYEVKIPWAKTAVEVPRIKKDSEIYFSLLVNDDDGGGRRGWIEYGGGIGSGANSIPEFYKLYLSK